eukprot:scaffold2735_cov61-Attheya_sp.AAC.6
MESLIEQMSEQWLLVMRRGATYIANDRATGTSYKFVPTLLLEPTTRRITEIKSSYKSLVQFRRTGTTKTSQAVGTPETGEATNVFEGWLEEVGHVT